MILEGVCMNTLDHVIVILFFVGVLAVGLLSGRFVKSTDDYYIAGGKIPWWLSGISHHVSGYSAVVFTGYAGIAYITGTAIYFWWAVNIGLAMVIGAYTVVPRWPRLRRALGIQSPTEYLKTRYNVPAQILVSVSGVIVKVLDVGAKWASIGILLNAFTGMPIWIGIVASSLIALVYMAIGGLLADLLTDFAQFVVQVAAGIGLFIGVVMNLGDKGLTISAALSQLKDMGNLRVFNEGQGQGTPIWTLFYIVVVFLSYNGGTWNLAQRFISTTDDKTSRRSALFSAFLYLFWPLILFFPMFLGPILYPGLTQAQAEANLYSQLTMDFLPNGMIGLVLASMFANTITMCNSDMNVISAVLSRDILPIFKPDMLTRPDKVQLRNARLTTIGFTLATIIIALLRDQMGGITGLILTWFAALLGPTAIPLIFGLFRQFRYSDSTAAILAIIAGFGVFIADQAGMHVNPNIAIILPTAVSFAVYWGVGLINRYIRKIEISDVVDNLLDELGSPITVEVEPD